MKHKLIIIFAILLIVTKIVAQQKISISPDNIVNLSTWGDATLLVDEQDYVGNPATGDNIVPQTKFQTGFQSWKYPVSVLIDLKGIYQLTDIYLFDSNGSGNVELYAGTPFEWDLLFTYGQGAYNRWQGFSVDIQTRYVMIKIYSVNIMPEEIILYGSFIEEIVEIVEPIEMQKPLMQDFIGVNAFINDPIETMDICGFIREYHDWSFTEVAPNVFEFNRWNGYWDFDNYYETGKQKNVTIVPCLQSNVLVDNVELHSSPGRKKPLYNNQDSLDPLSYAKHSQFMYQYAARYGSVEVNESNLLLNANQDIKTGLGYINYYESWNEQDRWWEGKNGWFSPFEYSAMLSADYDGHMGQLGDGYGIKTADPNAKMVMGGLASLDLEYIKSMMFWAKYNRNGDLPFQVINLHHYSNDLGGQGNSTVGVSPEEDDLKGRIRRVTDFRDTYLPGVEVWITEFGYDTHFMSVQRAPAYGNFTAYQVQAFWLIRSYLAILAGGADRAAMFMVRNVREGATQQYSTSGLVTDIASGNQKKDSWFYLSTFYNQLKNYRYDGEVESNNSNVWIYRFKELDTNNEAFVVWCPTSNSTEVENFQLIFDEEKLQVDIIEFQNQNLLGNVSNTFNNVEAISMKVTEEPVIVKTVSANANYQVYNFNEGWNLISFNKEISNMSIDSVFAPVIDNLVSIKTFDMFYLREQNENFNSLKNIDLSNAYLVKFNSNTSLYYSGIEPIVPITEIELKQGWNLLPIPIFENKSIEDALSSVWEYIEVVKDFEEYYEQNSSTNSLEVLRQGKGYFIKVSEDCILRW